MVNLKHGKIKKSRRLLTFVIWLLVLSLFISCSTTNYKNKTDTPRPFVVKEVTLYPGQIKLVQQDIPKNFLSSSSYSLICNSRKMVFYTDQKKIKMYLSETYFSKIKDYSCFLKDKKNHQKIFNIRVVKYNYPSEKLSVDPRRVTLSKKNLARVLVERKMLRKLYAKAVNTPYFTDGFSLPLDSFITSQYGTRRVFNGVKKSQHLGVDFRAAVGVPIPCANSGKVLFVGNLFYSGNVVIIDHGAGIITNYGHLSKIKVQTGDYLPKGTVVGLSGKTGRVSGPHLHWGTKNQGNWVDGRYLVNDRQPTNN